MTRQPSKFFVTGLCLQGNKGGPALALSLVDAVRREIPHAEFVFSVPAISEEWEHEVRWADRYGFKVCKIATLSCVVPPFCLRPGRLRRFSAWWKALRSCDAMIEMSAICYTGPPAGIGTLGAVISSPRWSYFMLSRAARRPMLAWTQSYGPLSTPALRFFARRDLRRQPIVFCRGADCAASVSQLLPAANVMSFPDVATTLRFDREWGRDYVNSRLPAFDEFVTLSPSAVMYSRGKQAGDGNSHLNLCRGLCEQVIRTGHKVILVPHTLRPSRRNPNVCDLTVAELVQRSVGSDRVGLIDEDLSPKELKSIIANAVFHIGARYHSVVAALSSGVPAISLSWHPKYRDLMRTYDMTDYVVEEHDAQTFSAVLGKLETEKMDLRKQLAARQADVAEQVRENARLFCRHLQTE